MTGSDGSIFRLVINFNNNRYKTHDEGGDHQKQNDPFAGILLHGALQDMSMINTPEFFMVNNK